MRLQAGQNAPAARNDAWANAVIETPRGVRLVVRLLACLGAASAYPPP
jgi:hypothetical protein